MAANSSTDGTNELPCTEGETVVFAIPTSEDDNAAMVLITFDVAMHYTRARAELAAHGVDVDSREAFPIKIEVVRGWEVRQLSRLYGAPTRLIDVAAMDDALGLPTNALLSNVKEGTEDIEITFGDLEEREKRTPICSA